MTTLSIPRPRLTITAFYRLDPDPTPDPAGLARWVARAQRPISCSVPASTGA